MPRNAVFLFVFALASSFGIGSGEVWGQTSVQNFGTGTGTHSSQTGSTAFIPNPTSGTTWVRAGATAPNAPLVLATASNPLGTTGAYVRGVASTSTSVTKFSPMVGYTGSTEFYTSFKVLFGDGSGGNTVSSGSWSFYQGAGAMFSDANDFAAAQVFSGLRFTYASGVVTLQNRVGGAWNTTGLTTTSFNQATVYTIEIVGNNKTSGTINYIYNGVAQTVAVQKFDLFINGTKIGDDLGEAALPTNTNISSNCFIGISSTANAANAFVDDVVVYNSIPATIGTTTYLAVVPATLSGFNYVLGTGPSSSQYYNLSGSNLAPASGNITVTAPTNYEVSSDDITFGSSVSVPYSSSNFTDVPVFIRLKSGLPAGNYNGQVIVNSGGGASNVNVTCNGNVSLSCLTTSIPIISGTPYTEDFDVLFNTGTSSTVPCGWAFAEIGGNSNYTADIGTNTIGDTYSYGSLLANDRAFGTLQTGAVIPTIGAQFTNSTGFTINSLTIEYTGEQWRNGGSNYPDKLQFSYSKDATSLTNGTWTSVTNLDFSSPVTSSTAGSLDGNASANRTQLTHTITGLTISAGSTFWIRWSDFNQISGSGIDDGLAIDDFSINASLTCPLTITGFTPAIGPIGTSVTISGTNFTPNTSVLFDGIASNSITFISSTSLIAIVPPGATFGQITVDDNCVTVSSLAFNVLGTSCTTGATDLIISEYYEGAGNDKAIEIANFTGSPISLSGYSIDTYTNGSATPVGSMALTPGILPNNSVYILAHSSANSSILALAQQTTAFGWFNGNDAVVLQKSGVIKDIFGNIGCDPGTDWTDGGMTTKDVDLVRNASVINGITTDNSTSCPFPTLPTEWTAYDYSDLSHLGNHTSNYNTSPPIISTQPQNSILPACVGTSVTYSVTAASGVTPYTYTWYYNTGSGNWTSVTPSSTYTITNTSNTSTLVISNIPFGLNNYQYYCEVSNPGGTCFVASNAVLLKLYSLPATPAVGTITQPTCIVTTGSVELSSLPSGNWTINPGGITGSTNTTTIGSLVAAGTYNFTVTNADGCTSLATANIVINAIPGPPTATATNNSPFCEGGTLNITGSASGGLPGYTYNWTGPSNFPNQQNPSISNAGPANNGTYTLAVTDANGCSASASTIVLITALPAQPILTATNLCTGSTNSVFTASGGSIYEFLVNGVVKQAASTNNSFTLTDPLEVGKDVCVRSYSPFVLDGSFEPSKWGNPLATSAGGAVSQFPFLGNNIDVFYMQSIPNYVIFGIAGQLVNNSGHKLLVFIDSKSGGYNHLADWNARGNSPYYSIRNLDGEIYFDNGFAPDYIIGINQANSNEVYYDYYDMQGNAKIFLGSNLNSAYLDKSLLGYQSNSGVGDYSNGFEFTIPTSLIGSPAGPIKVFTMIVNDPGEFAATTLSNQFLTRANSGENNYGNGYVDFNNAAPNPITIPLLSSTSCYSQTCLGVTSEWTGATSSNWEENSNWSCGTPPTQLIDAKIPSSTSSGRMPVVNKTIAADCRNIEIQPGATVTIESDLTHSGSLIINGSSSGTGTITYNRYLENNKWYILSSPVNNSSNQTTFTDANLDFMSTSYNIADLLEASNTWNYRPSLTFPLINGKGYLAKLKASASNILSFTGTPNNTLTDVAVQSTGTYLGWNAVGNPFTSALKISDATTGFLDVNSTKLEDSYAAIYLWSANASDYITISKSAYTPIYGFVNLPTETAVQAGQGFLINVKKPQSAEPEYPNGTVNRTITFNKGTGGMQVHSTGTSIKRSQSSWPGITLLALAGGRTRSTIVAFNPGMTTSLDPSYDAGLLSVSDFNVYTRLAAGNNETNFTIQCLPDNQYDSLVVPVGLDMPQAGLITFKADGVILPDGVYPVIEDRLDHISTPLKTPLDSLTTYLAEPDWGTGRFYLHFGNTSSLVSTDELKWQHTITASYSNQEITVFGTPETGSLARLFDVNGRMLGSEYRLASDNINRIPARGLQSGIYLLRIDGKTSRQTLKITVLDSR